MAAETLPIRDAEVEDWPHIAALLGRSPDAGVELRRWAQEQFDATVTLVAGAPDGPAAGAAVAGLPPTAPGREDQERVGRLTWIGVGSPFRRHGLGTRLLDAVGDELRLRGARRLGVTLEGTEVEAIAFFRKAGFERDGQDLGLIRSQVARPAVTKPNLPATIRWLTLDDVPLLTGLIIRLGMERAEAIHDQLEAFTPAQVESWLQRPGTLGYAAWEKDDPQTPVGIAWASRRREDAVLRYIAVIDDNRRDGVGTALLAAIVSDLERAGALPLRAALSDPGEEAEFFRSLGFEAERVTLRMSKGVA